VTVGVEAVTVVAETPRQEHALEYLTAGTADGVDVVCGTEDAVTVLIISYQSCAATRRWVELTQQLVLSSLPSTWNNQLLLVVRVQEVLSSSCLDCKTKEQREHLWQLAPEQILS
jgi:hypothetical protein